MENIFNKIKQDEVLYNLYRKELLNFKNDYKLMVENHKQTKSEFSSEMIRITHIAYSMLKGKSYREIEYKCRDNKKLTEFDVKLLNNELNRHANNFPVKIEILGKNEDGLSLSLILTNDKEMEK